MAEILGNEFQQLHSAVQTSSSTENIGLFVPERKLLFTSDWHFKDKGVAEAGVQLIKDLEKYNIRIVFSWEEEYSAFVITCRPGETDHVSSTFLQILQGIIAKECEVDPEDDNSSSCSALEDVQPNTRDKIIPLSEWLQTQACEGIQTKFSTLQNDQPFDGQHPPAQRNLQTSHIFHSEEPGDFQVVLKYIVDVGKRYFETTLLDYLESPLSEDAYNSLHCAIITRCASYDHRKNIYAPVKEAKYRRATLDLDTSQRYRDWANFTYHEHGVNSISQQIAQGSLPQGQGQQLLQQHRHQSSDPMTHMAANNAANLVAPSLPERRSGSPSLLDDDSSVLGIPSLLDAPMATSATQADEFDLLLSFCDQPTVDPELRSTNRAEERLHTPSPAPERQQEVSEISLKVGDNKTSQKSSKSPKSSKGRREKSSAQRSVNRLPILYPIPHQPQPGNQIDQIILQAAPEFNNMLEDARDFHGKVTVQVCFGRILLRNLSPNLIAKRESDISQRRDWLCNFLTSNQASTSFTKVLTSVAQDVHFLVDLKDNTGDRMWDIKPYQWGICYEFQYYSRVTGTSFTIEADGESLQCKVYTHRSLSHIFVHGLKRHWDLQVAMDGYTDEMEKYGELVDAIKRTLSVPSGMNTPFMCFQLRKATHQNYLLDAVRVRRTTHFRKDKSGPSLKISEFQDLDVCRRDESDASVRVYRAAPNKQPRSPLVKLDMWYEASISCPRIEEKLEELQSNKEMKPTPEELLKLNGAEHLLLPALEMLKQIDGVGSWNHNEIIVRSPVPEPPASSPLDLDSVW